MLISQTRNFFIFSGHSKFALQSRDVNSIFDVDFENSGKDLLMLRRGLRFRSKLLKIGGRKRLHNNDVVITKVGLNLLLSIEVVSFISQLMGNLKGFLSFLTLFADWADHYSLEWVFFIFFWLIHRVMSISLLLIIFNLVGKDGRDLILGVTDFKVFNS